MKISYLFAFLLVDAHYSKIEENKQSREILNNYYGEISNSDSGADATSADEENVNGTSQNKGGVIPWCWPKTRKWFNFPADSDSYPLHGFRHLPRNCSDYETIIQTDEDWNALTKLYDEVYKLTINNKGAFSELVAISTKNKNVKGARLFKAYFERVWRRARRHEWINSTMRDLEVLPFQVYDAQRQVWPMPPKNERSKNGPPPISVASVSNTLNNFLEAMFGSKVRQHSSFEIIGRSIYYHYWDNWNRRGAKANKKREDLRSDYSDAKKAFESGTAKDSKEAFELARNMMRSGKKYLDLERVYAGRNREKVLKECEEEMNIIVQSAKEQKDKSRGLVKGIVQFLELIKDPETIAALEDEYRSTFNTGEMVNVSGDESFERFLDGFGDLGVAQYANMTFGELYERLGLEAFYSAEYETLRCQPFPFLNSFVSQVGELPPDIEGFYDLQAGTPKEKLEALGLSELRIRWHQLVGACAVVDRCIGGLNVLLADSVGLGKTLICYLSMAYLRHLRVIRTFHPPIFPEGSTWGWKHTPGIPPGTPFPNGQFLVCVPNLLLSQWQEEGIRFMQNSMWSFLVYPSSSSQAKNFWKAWDQRNLDNESQSCTTVVFVSHQTLRREAKDVINVPPRTKSRKFNTTTPFKMSQRRLPHSIFGRKWAMTFFDEAHELRSEGSLNIAAHALRLLSGNLVLCTATPLYNSEKDLPSLAFVLGVSDTIKQRLITWERELASTIGKVRRNNRNKEVVTNENEQSTLSAQKTGLSTLMSGNLYSMTKLEQKIARARLDTVENMRNIFQKYIIRRTNNSLIWDNVTQVNPLPPCITHDYTLEMNTTERNVLDAIRARVVEEVTKEFDIDQIPTRYFFNEYRLCISHTGYKSKANGSPEVIPETWTSYEDWKENRSTKWANISDLALALLRNDDGPFPYTRQKRARDSTLIDDFELVIPKDVDVDATAQGKLIIYVEFTKLLNLLVDGLKMEGLNPLVLTGATSVKKRAEALKKFKDSNLGYRVLILSSIGGAGLNLHEARFMIFADNVWSSQQQEQIIGRIHRRPQQYECHVYIPRLAGSSDMALRHKVTVKEKLLELFVDREKYSKDFEVESDDDIEEYTDNSDEAGEVKKKSLKKAGKKKEGDGKTNLARNSTRGKRQPPKSPEDVEFIDAIKEPVLAKKRPHREMSRSPEASGSRQVLRAPVKESNPFSKRRYCESTEGGMDR